MASKIIQAQRIQKLNKFEPANGDYVLYWMQQSQRAHYNHALEYAVQQANVLDKPLLVVFGLMDGYPEANLRHYRFMLEGLAETQRDLQRRGIPMDVRRGNPADVALQAGRKAALIVCDRGYLRHQKQWRSRLVAEAERQVVQVEADAVVPVEVASDKVEFGARTLRPKINKHKADYLLELRTTVLDKDASSLGGEGIDLENLAIVLDGLDLDRSVEPVALFTGGNGAARRTLKRFIERDLEDYQANRNQPQTNHVSHMSKYLHFGQISPVYLALQIAASGDGDSVDDNIDTYLEELLVRRELALNFVHFHPNYDSFRCIPEWAAKTLAEHRDDKREHRYTRAELENAETHDEYWNAAMREMKFTGFMHNYMRMYWGKKILEWTNTPEYGYRLALALNNKYFLDGRDANSYAGVAWCFGLHDRPWQERPVFGKVRYMNAAGLERKCDPKAYIDKVDNLVAAVRGG